MADPEVSISTGRSLNQVGKDAHRAAWDAFRTGQVTWLTDVHGRIAAIVPVAVAQGSRKLADMTPAERRAAGERAIAQLGAELTANADAIGIALDEAEALDPGQARTIDH